MKNTMKLAWSNASIAHKYHGKGSKAEYLSGSMKLAHQGVNLKHDLMAAVVPGSIVAVTLGLGLGATLANILY